MGGWGLGSCLTGVGSTLCWTGVAGSPFPSFGFTLPGLGLHCPVPLFIFLFIDDLDPSLSVAACLFMFTASPCPERATTSPGDDGAAALTKVNEALMATRTDEMRMFVID